MTNVMVYRIERRIEGIRAPNFLAYVVLPDGSFWGVRFEGDTEEAVRANAIALYEKEKSKWHTVDSKSEDGAIKHERTDMRGQHLVGTVCMINHRLKQRMRCKAVEVSKFEVDGWVKGGPRTPFQE